MPTQGPFPNELFTHPPVVTDYQQVSGNGGPEIPLGATAQNDYKALKWFKCKSCADVIKESELTRHVCPDIGLQSYLNTYEDDLDDDTEDEEYDDDEDDFSSGRAY